MRSEQRPLLQYIVVYTVVFIVLYTEDSGVHSVVHSGVHSDVHSVVHSGVHSGASKSHTFNCYLATLAPLPCMTHSPEPSSKRSSGANQDIVPLPISKSSLGRSNVIWIQSHVSTFNVVEIPCYPDTTGNWTSYHVDPMLPETMLSRTNVI